MPVIDADTHVVEAEQTWNYLDPSEQQFRPVIVRPYGDAGKDCWLIDGTVRGAARQAANAGNLGLADSAGGFRDRLKWMGVLPLQSIPDSIDMLGYCQENGAAGIFMRGIEGEYLIHDPYFYPLYQEVIRRNMTVGVHAGI